MSSYRVIWFFFMSLIFIPGFLFASTVEGIDFFEATDTIHHWLNKVLYFPNFLANILSIPVTIVATLLPGTSSFAMLLGNIVWEGVGLIFTFFFLIMIRPPFYKPDEEITQTYNGLFQSRPFSRGVGILLVFWLVAEVLFAFLRDPIADTYTGNVYFVENGKIYGTKRPIKANAKVDVVDAGYVYDRRPGVYFDGLRVEFSGEELSKLRALGVPEKLLSKAEERTLFAEHFCEAYKIVPEKNASAFNNFPDGYHGGQFDYAAAFHLKFSQTDENNCKGMHLGIIDFNYVQLAIDGVNRNGFILVDLKRESHISPLQRFIMWLTFDRNNISLKYGSKV